MPGRWCSAAIRRRARRSRKRSGRFGPYVQLGDGKEAKRASIPKDVPQARIELDWALKLLSLPRTIGAHPETGKPITASDRPLRPVSRSMTANMRGCTSTAEVFETGMNAAVVKLAEAAAGGGRGRGAAREPLSAFGDSPETGKPVKLMEGRFGPYVTDGVTNATLPKTADPATMTAEEALALLAERAAKGPAKGKKPVRKAARRRSRRQAKAEGEEGGGEEAAAKKAPAKASERRKSGLPAKDYCLGRTSCSRRRGSGLRGGLAHGLRPMSGSSCPGFTLGRIAVNSPTHSATCDWACARPVCDHR